MWNKSFGMSRMPEGFKAGGHRRIKVLREQFRKEVKVPELQTEMNQRLRKSRKELLIS